MIKYLKKITIRLLPNAIVSFIHKQRKKYLQNNFIQIKDSVSNQSFYLDLRNDNFIENQIHTTGLYGGWEKESLRIWANLAQHANTIIDIGANTGVFSHLAWVNNPKATIIAVEPIPINYSILAKNIRKNKANISVEQCALSNKNGNANMFMLKNKVNYMTSVNENRYALHPEIQKNQEVIEVNITIHDFKYLVSKYNLSTIDLIKLDVEGHEIQVLESMMPNIINHKPTILIEVISDEIAKYVEYNFKSLGYKFIAIDEVNPSKEVEHIWDNDHHNFLLVTEYVYNRLKSIKLIE